MALFIFVAFSLMSLIFGVGYGVLSRIAGVAYVPEATNEVIREFLGNYGLQVTLAFVSVMIASIYAAFSALLMKSILGGIMVGIGISVAEPLVVPGSLSFARLFDTVFFLHLGRLSPYYNIENVNSWVRHDQALDWLEPAFQLFQKPPPFDSLNTSILVLAGWLVLGIGMVLHLFQRQDITT